MLWHQISFQDALSSIMECMIFFYDYIMSIIMMIIIIIIYMMIFIMKNKFVNRYFLENQYIEMIWTILPMFFLLFMALPSLKLLYMTDETFSSDFTFKIIGHQWYWEYEYNLIKMNQNLKIMSSIDSLIKKNMNLDSFRMLDVSMNFLIPLNCKIQFLITSDDVIHSFSMLSLGIKIDAIPGRINQISTYILQPGIFYGQCSEICGINHSFMPIVIEVINLNKWFNKILNLE